jgi:hypothetical protein
MMDLKKINRELQVISCVAILFLFVFLVTILSENSVASASGMKEEKLVMKIQIQEGDTLWDIASDNMSDHYDSINDYIHEIKECNSLISDTIHEGQFLIIPYYDVN